jgi:hypothetical protein
LQTATNFTEKRVILFYEDVFSLFINVTISSPSDLTELFSILLNELSIFYSINFKPKSDDELSQVNWKKDDDSKEVSKSAGEDECRENVSEMKHVQLCMVKVTLETKEEPYHPNNNRWQEIVKLIFRFTDQVGSFFENLAFYRSAIRFFLLFLS